MKSLNVRLGPEDAAAIKWLRGEGVELSSLVRQTIRAEYEARRKKSGKAPMSEIIKQIIADHPEPDVYVPLGVDVTNRREASAYIRSRINRKRS